MGNDRVAVKAMMAFAAVLATAVCARADMAEEDSRREAAKHWNQGTVAYQNGERGAAREEWQLCTKLDPKNEDCRKGLEKVEASLTEDKASVEKILSSADGRGLVAGYRGTAVPVAGYQSMFIKRGDRVDVLVTFEAKMKDAKEKVTATILQNCLVIDVIKPVDPEKAGIINILLNPNEAQYLALALKQGELHVTVRAPGDTSMHPMEMASFRKLFR